jgi:hypothetical protein
VLEVDAALLCPKVLPLGLIESTGENEYSLNFLNSSIACRKMMIMRMKV